MFEALKQKGFPVLHISVKTLKHEYGSLYTYIQNIQLSQDVLLERNINISFIAPTWQRRSVRYVGIERLDSIRDSIKDYIDKFINDYLTVNPREIKVQ